MMSFVRALIGCLSSCRDEAELKEDEDEDEAELKTPISDQSVIRD